MQFTPLYQQHIAANAKIIDFHGWAMPLHYGSQLSEHHQVRQAAGMFDVSHMTQIDVTGNEADPFVNLLFTYPTNKPGRALYTCMCNHNGGIIDDLIIYSCGHQYYRIIFNAVTRTRVLSWLQQIACKFAVNLTILNQAMIAVQGPQAIAIVKSILPTTQATIIANLSMFDCAQVAELFFAYTGYTGEHGLEIMGEPDKIVQLWQKLYAAGVHPCGLGARDTLRLEAGLLLSQQDMDESTSPFESDLAWVVEKLTNERDFIGKTALIEQQAHGVQRKLVGLILENQGIMRTGQPVLIANHPNGIITSGGYSPTLACSIAFARIPCTDATHVQVLIRDKLCNANIVKRRFLLYQNCGGLVRCFTEVKHRRAEPDEP